MMLPGALCHRAPGNFQWNYNERHKLYTATLIIAKAVIPAKAGIQKNTGFRVEPGMTNRIRLMSSCKVDVRVASLRTK